MMETNSNHKTLDPNKFVNTIITKISNPFKV